MEFISIGFRVTCTVWGVLVCTVWGVLVGTGVLLQNSQVSSLHDLGRASWHGRASSKLQVSSLHGLGRATGHGRASPSLQNQSIVAKRVNLHLKSQRLARFGAC
ncbi:hypothetical protein JCGZ_03249 [Jatropha curcas]|uniref:Uncharacterized protein n=1 Tax=Jatropha curcas TaxID=180498 RepID=A0A067JQX1_JATCU|nr:hypothetical protein JCGZ_03249 [Jatropha curcas]